MEPALKNSFISSSNEVSKSRSLPWGFFLAVLLIVVIEAGLVGLYRLGAERYGGESSNWIHVKRIETNRMDKSRPVVILGDSTAVSQNEKWEELGTVNLSLKVWDTMAGLYFIFKKYLEAGGRPKLCVLLTADYFWEEEMADRGAVDQARDSLFRPLTSWPNVFDLAFKAKRGDLAKEMFLEGILPSRRFKGPVSNWLGKLGIYHLEIKRANLWETDIPEEAQPEAVPKRGRTGPIRLSSLSRHYFNEIYHLCRRYGIQLIVLESSISASRLREEKAYADYAAELTQFLSGYGAAYRNRQFVFPDEAFGKDQVHLVTDEMQRRFAEAVFREIRPFLRGKP